MPLNLALCCARGRGAYCCPPPGDHPAPPLRADAAAANDDGGGDWCCYEELPVSTPPHVPRGLARGGEDEDEDDDDGLELTMTRGAPGVRDDADDQQLVSPAAAAGGVGFVAKSWIASVYERLSRTFSVLP